MSQRDFIIPGDQLEQIVEDEEVEEFIISDFSHLPEKQDEERFESGQQMSRRARNKINSMPTELKNSLTGSLDKSK